MAPRVPPAAASAPPELPAGRVVERRGGETATLACTEAAVTLSALLSSGFVLSAAANHYFTIDQAYQDSGALDHMVKTWQTVWKQRAPSPPYQTGPDQP